MLGSACLAGVRPNRALLLGPISLACAMPSPLVASTTLEQPLPAALMSQSNQLRMSLCKTSGLYRFAKSVVKFRLYLFTLPLIAVLASPVRSYAAPNRGARFFQFGIFGIAGNDRAGTKRPASTAFACAEEL